MQGRLESQSTVRLQKLDMPLAILMGQNPDQIVPHVTPFGIE